MSRPSKRKLLWCDLIFNQHNRERSREALLLWKPMNTKRIELHLVFEKHFNKINPAVMIQICILCGILLTWSNVFRLYDDLVCIVLFSHLDYQTFRNHSLWITHHLTQPSVFKTFFTLYKRRCTNKVPKHVFVYSHAFEPYSRLPFFSSTANLLKYSFLLLSIEVLFIWLAKRKRIIFVQLAVTCS